MKMTAAAAIGALILAASAAPALAGGYWDGGVVQGGQAEAPGPAYADRDCPCNCPPDRDGRGWREQRRWGDRGDNRYGDDRGWSDRGQYYSEDRGEVDERVYDSGWQDQDAYDDEDYAPAEYFDSGYGVGPDVFIDEGGGGGDVGFAGAGAFAGADAFADVGVDVDIRDRFHDHFRDHDHDHHDHHMYPPMHDHQYPQHPGYPHAWGSMQPMQPHMMSGWGHMGGVGHVAMAHGGMVMHGGGRRR